jgi:hypothetical protein
MLLIWKDKDAADYFKFKPMIPNKILLWLPPPVLKEAAQLVV